MVMSTTYTFTTHFFATFVETFVSEQYGKVGGGAIRHWDSEAISQLGSEGVKK
jgi:hypothetical protein